MPSPSAGGSTLVSSPAGRPSKDSRLRRFRPRRSPRSTGGAGSGAGSAIAASAGSSGSAGGTSTAGTSPDNGLGDSSSWSASSSSVDDGEVDQAGGADLLVELLERRVGLLLDAPGGRVGRQPRVGQRGGQLVGGLVDGAAHHRVGLQQPLATGVELLDLLARLLATHRQVAQHALADRLRLRDHLLALGARAAASSCSASSRVRSRSRCALVAERLGLLGRLGPDQRRRFLRLGLAPVELGAGLGDQRVVLGGGFGQPALGVAHRLGARLGRFEGGVGDDPLGGRLGLAADLPGGLASRREHAGGLLPEHLEQHRLVGAVGEVEARLGSLGPLPELEHLALEPVHEGLDLVQVAPHLLLLVAAAGHLERAAGDVVAVGSIGHGTPMVGPTRACGRGRPDRRVSRAGRRGGPRRDRPRVRPRARAPVAVQGPAGGSTGGVRRAASPAAGGPVGGSDPPSVAIGAATAAAVGAAGAIGGAAVVGPAGVGRGRRGVGAAPAATSSNDALNASSTLPMRGSDRTAWSRATRPHSAPSSRKPNTASHRSGKLPRSPRSVIAAPISVSPGSLGRRVDEPLLRERRLVLQAREDEPEEARPSGPRRPGRQAGELVGHHLELLAERHGRAEVAAVPRILGS